MNTQPCQVDFVQINENKVRITAMFVLLSVVIYLLTDSVWIIAFLAVDFSLRAFNLGKYSILGFWSEILVFQFYIPNKPTDQVPKRFAAQMGFVFSAVIVLFQLFSWQQGTWVLGGFFILFSFLESAFGFCAGCYIYKFYGKMVSKKSLLFQNGLLISSKEKS